MNPHQRSDNPDRRPAIEPGQMLLVALEQALNHFIALDDEALARVEELQGKIIQLELTAPPLNLFVLTEGRRFRLLANTERPADAVLRGSVLAFARLRADRRAASELFEGRVTMGGDTGLAQRFGDILSGVELDWEEHLSRLIGDLAAHQLGNLTRRAGSWSRQARMSLELDLAEYLQEELRILPARAEVEDFLESVDNLRDDVERLEARMKRIIGRLERPSDHG